MLTMSTSCHSSDPQLLSLGPESVVERSPGLADRVGQPWVDATCNSATLKGLCNASDKIQTAMAVDGLRNPFRVGAPRDVPTQGWPPVVGQPWAVMHNPYGVVSRRMA